MWREMKAAAHPRFDMWVCCASTAPRQTTTSTTAATPYCFCTPMPSSRLRCHPDPTEVDELSVALASWFALEIFTSMQKDYPPADQASMLSDVELEQLGMVDLCELASWSLQHRWTCTCADILSPLTPWHVRSGQQDKRESPLLKPEPSPVPTTLPSTLSAIFLFHRREADE